MNFKTYDILSALVPGYVILIILLNFFNITYDKDLVVPYTAFAFLLGFFINTLSSWLEEFYFFTWGGKPSSCLLDGKNIWKVKFYEFAKTKQLLINECSIENPNNDQLFSIAMRVTNGIKENRVEDFNSNYAFTRVLLTTVLFATMFLLIKNYDDWKYYFILIPVLVVTWLRCKQRAYYYAREVLNEYLKKSY